jgi:FMN phosphatase YigB (HAD superfamily)
MFSPNGIQAILFDLDGTLRHSQPDGGETFVAHARSLGLPISDDDYLRAHRWEHHYWANSLTLRADFKKYNTEGPDFWQNYNRRQLVALGVSPRQAEELAPALSQHMREHFKPVGALAADTLGMLTQLKEAGFRLGVVSNRENPYEQEMNQLGIHSLFEFFLAAGEVQSYKPHPGIFEAALKRMEMTADATMYVGDNYFADVVGARRAGLRPVLYDPSGTYPDADCAVIASLDGLSKLLKK